MPGTQIDWELRGENSSFENGEKCTLWSSRKVRLRSVMANLSSFSPTTSSPRSKQPKRMSLAKEISVCACIFLIKTFQASPLCSAHSRVYTVQLVEAFGSGSSSNACEGVLDGCWRVEKGLRRVKWREFFFKLLARYDTFLCRWLIKLSRSVQTL